VRDSNKLAIGMYEKLGYATYRRVLGYYSGKDAEDALGAHAALLLQICDRSLPWRCCNAGCRSAAPVHACCCAALRADAIRVQDC
jgi:hypothetical protein